MLRHAIREHLDLPDDEKDPGYTGKDCVLVLLDRIPEAMHEKLMFVCWCAWHLRNDCIFGKGDRRSCIRTFWDKVPLHFPKY